MVGALQLLAAPELLACSICRCGDPTFNALGKDGYAARGFSLALDSERFDKDEGHPSEDMESQVENRMTALASYGWGEKLTLFARVPYSIRRQSAFEPGLASETVRTHGLSDPEIYGQVRLWASRMSGGLGRRTSLSVNLGVKPAWGRNNVQVDGQRADEHVQPGTGSTDVFGSLAFVYLIDKRSALFASGGYRLTSENGHDYRYGSSSIANLVYEHKLATRLDGALEMNFRHAQRDRVDAGGQLDDNTGGSLLYLTPRLLVSLGNGVVLRAAVQIPAVRALNGYQKERAVANLGLTYLFSR
jgi:hypothetical protein